MQSTSLIGGLWARSPRSEFGIVSKTNNFENKISVSHVFHIFGYLFVFISYIFRIVSYCFVLFITIVEEIRHDINVVTSFGLQIARTIGAYYLLSS